MAENFTGHLRLVFQERKGKEHSIGSATIVERYDEDFESAYRALIQVGHHSSMALVSVRRPSDGEEPIAVIQENDYPLPKLNTSVSKRTEGQEMEELQTERNKPNVQQLPEIGEEVKDWPLTRKTLPLNVWDGELLYPLEKWCRKLPGEYENGFSVIHNASIGDRSCPVWAGGVDVMLDVRLYIVTKYRNKPSLEAVIDLERYLEVAGPVVEEARKKADRKYQRWLNKTLSLVESDLWETVDRLTEDYGKFAVARALSHVWDDYGDWFDECADDYADVFVDRLGDREGVSHEQL